MWLILCLVLLGVTTAAVAAPTSITPATDFQAAVTAAPEGNVFVLTAGTHRRGSITPKTGQIFLGAPGAILSGAAVLTAWTADGSDWYVTGQTQQGAVLNAGQCLAGFEQCANPEGVFYDDAPLRGVANRAALGPGLFFFDYAADRIYIRDTPTGHTVETSVWPELFTGTAQQVTIKNLTIEKYASPTQEGAIEVSASSHGWTIENCLIRHNHGYGVHITGHGWTLRGNTISTNGHMGVGGVGKNTLLEGNTISDNNYARINPGFDAGGAKMTNVRALRFVRNQVHNNYGPGLWCDANCVDVLYADNVISGNYGSGLFHEISYRAVVRHNTSSHNGVIANWMFDGQINVANSERTEVYGNVVRIQASGGAGLALSQQSRGSGTFGPYRTQFNHVHHNTLRYAAGTSFNLGYSGMQDDFLDEIESQGNRWDDNVGFVSASASIWIRNECAGGTATHAAWQACGMDLHGVRFDP